MRKFLRVDGVPTGFDQVKSNHSQYSVNYTVYTVNRSPMRFEYLGKLDNTPLSNILTFY